MGTMRAGFGLYHKIRRDVRGNLGLCPLSHAAQRHDSSPVNVGASPLSLAALAGVSPALPQGEPSLRPWTEENFVVRRTFLRLFLTTNFAGIDTGTLGSPAWELSQGA